MSDLREQLMRAEEMQEGRGSGLFRQAADEIANLRAKLESAMDDNLIATQKIFKLESRLESARKALEPFGAFAAWVALEHPGWNHDEFRFSSQSEEMPKFKAWRDAYKVLMALTDETGK